MVLFVSTANRARLKPSTWDADCFLLALAWPLLCGPDRALAAPRLNLTLRLTQATVIGTRVALSAASRDRLFGLDTRVTVTSHQTSRCLGLSLLFPRLLFALSSSVFTPRAILVFGTMSTTPETTTSSATTTTLSTTAVLQALTTPFVAPPDCADQFLTYRSTYYNSAVTTILASGPADSRFASCQPSGWNAGPSFQFSPAVCPSGWTAYDVGGTISAIIEPATTHTRTFTTAYCCSR